MAAGTLLEVEIGADGNFGGAGHASTVQAPFEGRVLVQAAGGGGGADSEEEGGAGYRCRTDGDIYCVSTLSTQRGRGRQHHRLPGRPGRHRRRGRGAVALQRAGRRGQRRGHRAVRVLYLEPGAGRGRGGGVQQGGGAGAGSWSRRAGSHTGGGAAGTGHKPSKTSLLNR